MCRELCGSNDVSFRTLEKHSWASQASTGLLLLAIQSKAASSKPVPSSPTRVPLCPIVLDPISHSIRSPNSVVRPLHTLLPYSIHPHPPSLSVSTSRLAYAATDSAVNTTTTLPLVRNLFRCSPSSPTSAKNCLLPCCRLSRLISRMPAP